MLFTLQYNHIKAQNEGGIGIGTKTPHQSAILDISSESKGVLFPKVHISDTTNHNNLFAAPAEGLLVYNDSYKAGDKTGGNGFYYWTHQRGGRWIQLNPAEQTIAPSDITVQKTTHTAADDQELFPTPSTITDEKKITLYRNGVLIDFTIFNSNTLKSEIKCDAGDIIKIIQIL